MADNAADRVLGERRAIGQDELDMGFERLARDRRPLARQRVVGGGDGNQRDVG